MFYGHFCAHVRLNGPGDLQRQSSEVKDETPFRYAYGEIQTQVVVNSGSMRYQLNQGGAPL